MKPNILPADAEANAITISEGDLYYSFNDDFNGGAGLLSPIRRASYVARLRALADVLERDPL